MPENEGPGPARGDVTNRPGSREQATEEFVGSHASSWIPLQPLEQSPPGAIAVRLGSRRVLRCAACQTKVGVVPNPEAAALVGASYCSGCAATAL